MFDFDEYCCAAREALQLRLCCHVTQAFLLPQAADVKVDGVRTILYDPFGFVHKVVAASRKQRHFFKLEVSLTENGRYMI